MIRRNIRQNGGGLIFALILLAVGGYYTLRNTFGIDLGELDEDAVLPVIAVAFGLWFLYRSLTSSAEGPKEP
jgi:hypothetical protein